SYERRADEATRDAETALKCEFMLDKVGETFDGIITSATSFGIFIELQDIYIEGLVHITSLPKDYYQFDPASHKLIGERGGLVFQLGDSVSVTVANVNLYERKIDFELAGIKAVEDKRRKKPGRKPMKKTAKKSSKERSSDAPKEAGKKSAPRKRRRTKKKAVSQES
ncbi:MAG: S1 RNA-binding domain-containing protein, partial [Gammaproteobacteria bacterium]|nr:S1 RNA-binding domain-containing protein [Gammaproteobacteria bacterium]